MGRPLGRRVILSIIPLLEEGHLFFLLCLNWSQILSTSVHASFSRRSSEIVNIISSILAPNLVFKRRRCLERFDQFIVSAFLRIHSRLSRWCKSRWLLVHMLWKIPNMIMGPFWWVACVSHFGYCLLIIHSLRFSIWHHLLTLIHKISHLLTTFKKLIILLLLLTVEVLFDLIASDKARHIVVTYQRWLVVDDLQQALSQVINRFFH